MDARPTLRCEEKGIRKETGKIYGKSKGRDREEKARDRKGT